MRKNKSLAQYIFLVTFKFLFQISKLVLGKIFNNKNYDKIEKIGIKAFDYSNTKIKESKKKI